MKSYEQRRAPRTVVDIDAELHAATRVCRGTIHDLSFLGSLFIAEDVDDPEDSPELQPAVLGKLHFVLPTSPLAFSPSVRLRRTTTFPRPLGKVGVAVAFEFSELQAAEERAIALACYEWESYGSREFPLAAQCFVQGRDEVQNFSRFARLVSGSRDVLRFGFPKPVPLKAGHAVSLKLGQRIVAARIRSVDVGRLGIGVTARTEGWGRDFFLHAARRYETSS
ncbi:MAG: PilZ domain-containing protein [Chloroflexota bacterium]|nr:PilZ domain-containing protein [Chloroflexota bacterium]